ncbi:hypothetical protein [Streptantibioticus ferralitis]|uniref:Uncharacterized protein n=1 Tax=Streptantibioticus ferralitis TaxID=236510 RepID=A0ABT5ZBM9_9ACTN|nr:hypothetical protein [Streptantibioticus ferralitis]MDF2261247.1 hypothetical protein [Streptantibioticus ferralitis]
MSHRSGRREYAVVPLDRLQPLDDVLPDTAHHLSRGAITYAALTRAAQLRPGDTVFGSGGTGSIGSMTARIARLLGAGRVIGSASSAVKCGATPQAPGVAVRRLAALDAEIDRLTRLRGRLAAPLEGRSAAA